MCHLLLTAPMYKQVPSLLPQPQPDALTAVEQADGVRLPQQHPDAPAAVEQAVDPSAKADGATMPQHLSAAPAPAPLFEQQSADSAAVEQAHGVRLSQPQPDAPAAAEQADGVRLPQPQPDALTAAEQADGVRLPQPQPDALAVAEQVVDPSAKADGATMTKHQQSPSAPSGIDWDNFDVRTCPWWTDYLDISDVGMSSDDDVKIVSIGQGYDVRVLCLVYVSCRYAAVYQVGTTCMKLFHSYNERELCWSEVDSRSLLEQAIATWLRDLLDGLEFLLSPASNSRLMSVRNDGDIYVVFTSLDVQYNV